MFFKSNSKKKNEKIAGKINTCLTLKRRLKEMLDEKSSIMYGEPIWVNANLLVQIWNEQIDKIARDFPMLKKEIMGIRGYNAFDLPLDKQIPADQMGRKEDGTLYTYITCEHMITVRTLYENQTEADQKFFPNGYEKWRDCSEWQCSYANRNWPWITYLMAQEKCTIPQMENSAKNLIKELEEEIGYLKKKLVHN